MIRIKLFSSMCNVVRLLSPVVVFVVMINHPQANLSKILRCLRSLINIKFQKQPKMKQQLQSDSTKRTSMLIQLHTLNLPTQQGYLSQIKQQNKARLIGTILGCLALQQQDQYQSEDRSSYRLSQMISQRDQDLFDWNYRERYQFLLDQHVARQYSNIFSDRLPSINMKFISYCPSVFKTLQKQFKISNLSRKLLPKYNLDNIFNNISTSGGNSGQFFFFNYDSTLIIKTISSTQLNVFLSHLCSFHQHYLSQTQSLIVPIYGLYRTINQQTHEELTFMLMGNLIKNIQRKYIIRSFDMKGSTVGRRVLDLTHDVQNLAQEKRTLKDIDFHRLQGKIHITNQQSNTLKLAIQKDSQFLYSQGLIDYSLIVIKLDYQQYLSENQPINNIKIYKSTEQQGVVYIFGIIDYLQTWNIRKKGQKWYKSIFSKAQDISSQNPRFYSQRFMKNLIHMIFP